MREETRFICKHCEDEDCNVHCQKAENGEHSIDVPSLTENSITAISDAGDFEVEVICRFCGKYGSAWVSPSSVEWA